MTGRPARREALRGTITTERPVITPWGPTARRNTRPAGRWRAGVTQVVDHRLADIGGQRQPIQPVAFAPHCQLTSPPVDVVEPQRRDLAGWSS